jgi:hypothetical protein
LQVSSSACAGGFGSSSIPGHWHVWAPRQVSNCHRRCGARSRSRPPFRRPLASPAQRYIT